MSQEDGTAGTISVGDVVVQYRHYEFDISSYATEELLDGPKEGLGGTKWRVVGIGSAEGAAAPAGWAHTGAGAPEPVVDLELVEGAYQHRAPYEESELPDDHMQRIMMRMRGKTVSEAPGYVMHINNSPAYREHHPDLDLIQQFYDEWRKAA